jgi:beta-glucosidase
MSDSPIHSAKQWPGTANQSGVPHSVYSEKLLVGYRWYDAKHIVPLFPFGFGLSYTTFGFSHLRVVPTHDGARARFAVINTGTRPGAEVAQLYVADPAGAHEPPKQLEGYIKVALQPGERTTVTLRLHRRSFAYWNPSVHAWRVAAGCYRIRVGDSSRHLPLHTRIGRGRATC